MEDRCFSARVSELPGLASKLRAGDRIILSGTVYTARDAAHKRIFELMEAGEKLPFELEGAVIYYVGPTPSNGIMPVGSCGPTTSGRMDVFAEKLYDLGVAATIGKGERSQAVISAIARNRALYLCAVGGAGALMSKHVKSLEEIAFLELGCESVKKMTVEDMPLTVGLDASGGSIYEAARKNFGPGK